MELGLNGKSALITGGSRGIGLATAHALAAEGVSLHLAARGSDALERARSGIRQRHGVAVEIHPADLTSTEAARALAKKCPEIDILVNNAGAIPGGSLEEIDESTWRNGWELKVFGYITMMRELYGQMKRRGRGVIVNVCGTAGNQPMAEHLPGITGNSALATLTRAVGGVSLDHGVRVVGVHPGDMANERGTMFLRRQAAERLGDPERWQEMLTELPGGRAGTDEDIANAIAFLASPRAGYISGVMMTIDGGLGARRQVV